MAEKDLNDKDLVPEACPHCGNRLSSWQQVLLKVDRALVCKHCWYRILLDVNPTGEEEKNNNQNNLKNEEK